MNLVNLKLSFFTKLNNLKVTFLILHQKNTGNQEYTITLLLDKITFLKDQLRQTDKVIDSLINQFSQQNSYLVIVVVIVIKRKQITNWKKT